MDPRSLIAQVAATLHFAQYINMIIVASAVIGTFPFKLLHECGIRWERKVPEQTLRRASQNRKGEKRKTLPRATACRHNTTPRTAQNEDCAQIEMKPSGAKHAL